MSVNVCAKLKQLKSGHKIGKVNVSNTNMFQATKCFCPKKKKYYLWF